MFEKVIFQKTLIGNPYMVVKGVGNELSQRCVK